MQNMSTLAVAFQNYEFDVGQENIGSPIRFVYDPYKEREWRGWTALMLTSFFFVVLPLTLLERQLSCHVIYLRQRHTHCLCRW